MFGRRRPKRNPELDDYTVEPMEPRVLLSADALGVDAGVLDHDSSDRADWDLKDADDWSRSLASHDIADPAPLAPVGGDADDRVEIVFLDTGVEDGQQLLADLFSENGSAITQVHLLDSNSDGVDQIAQVLAGQQGIDAIHIISHGAAGQIQLGGGTLSTRSLDGYSGQLNDWGSALADSGDILIYGCDLAADTQGRALVNTIGILTGADVAASVDQTGHAAQGADWDLEYRAGSVEAVAFSPREFATWHGTLATFIVDTTGDTVDATPGDGNALDASSNTSLRTAIMEANALGGSHTIVLAADTYLLSIGGKGDAFDTTGDLDISADITITGTGGSQTVIDAAGVDRIFDVQSGGSLTLSGMTLQGGDVITGISENGGALRIGTGAAATASDVLFAGNTARSGGAIANTGTLGLTDSMVDNNSATQSGGGIVTSGPSAVATLERVTVSNNLVTTGFQGGGIAVANGSFTAINLTVSGNTAGSLGDGDGGGIHTARAISLINSTITDNDALYGSGIYTQGGGSVSLLNTIVAGNNNSADVYGTFVSSNNNLIGDVGSAAGLTDGVNGNQVGSGGSPIDARLGALRDNGGSMWTHALLYGSPAIDAGDNTGAPVGDQRGYSRDDGMADIGASESGAAPASVELTDLGGEFLVNDTTLDQQQTMSENRGSLRSIAIAPDGDYVVVWSTQSQDASNWAVYAQRFDSSGTELGTEFQVNSFETNSQYHAAVDMDDAGNFVVVWTSENQDPTASSVYARVFNADGSEAVSEFRVNTQTTGSQGTPTVAMTGSGEFVVAWQGEGPGDAAGIFARRFDVGGSALDATEILVNAVDRGTEINPAIAIDDAGNFVVAWTENNELYFQRFSADGSYAGGETRPIPSGSEFRSQPAVAMDPNGNFTIAWYYAGAAGDGVWAKSYDSSGAVSSTQYAGGQGYFKVSAGFSSDHTSPSISMDDDGNFIVVYEGSGDGAGFGVFGQKFDSNSDPIGGEFQINQTVAGTQDQVSVAMLDSDNFVAVWSGNGSGDTDGVSARAYGTSVAPVADAGADQTISEGDDLNFSGAASSDADGSIVLYEWDLNNDGSFETAGMGGTFFWSGLQGAGIDDDGTYDVALRVTDDDGAQHTDVFTLTVENTAPTLAVTGTGSVDAGNLYSLDLTASDPGDDTVTSYTINWGDGTVTTEAYTGTTTTVTHTYDQVGFTYNITFSALDEDAVAAGISWTSSDLVVGNWNGGSEDIHVFDGVTGDFESLFSTSGGDVDKPYSPVMGPDGNIYAGGYDSDNIVRFAPDGTYLGVFVASGTLSPGISLDGPGYGLAWGPDDYLYVANEGQDNILRFDDTGAFIDEFGVAGGLLDGPAGLAFGPDGDLYVSSWKNDTIVKYDGLTGGTPTLVLDAGLDEPDHLLFDDAGNLYIANAAKNEVSLWDGSTLTTYLAHANLDYATGMAFGPDGAFYVSSYDDDLILRYDGSTVSTFVAAGSNGLDKPGGLLFTPAHQVTVIGNDVPTLTSFASPVTSGDEDSGIEVTFGHLAVQGDEADADGTVDGFVVKSVTSGTLKIGANAASATAWAAGSNDTLDALTNAYWTPDPDANGALSAFEVVALDDDGAESTTPVAVQVTVNPINDPPTATNLTTTSAYNEGDSSVAITDIVVGDVDTGETVTATLKLVDTSTGSLSANDGASYTLSTGVWTITGTVANVNLALGNLVFNPVADNDKDTTIDVTIDDGDEDSSGPLTGTITLDVTPIDDEQVLVINAGMTVDEGTAGNKIDPTMLSTTDVDNTAGQIVYTLTALPSYGTVYLNAGALGLLGTFTQDDIDNGRVTYEHDGSETTTDGFGFSVDDGAGTATTGTFSITVTPQNDEQVLSINTGTTVLENSTGTTITSAMLDTTDVDNSAAQVVYTLTGVPGNGTLYLSGTPLVVSNTFTQDDLDNNRLSYDHDGSETTTDGFGFSVDDGAGTATTGTFSITVTPQNDNNPTLVNPIPDQSATEDLAFSLQFAAGTFDDLDSGDTLSYSAQQAGGTPLPGWLSFDGATRTFSGTPLNGDVGALNIAVTATDGVGATVSDSFRLAVSNVNDAPVLGNNQMTLYQGDTVVITTAMLSATDVDHASAGLQFTVSGVAGGQFELTGASGVAITSFTQAQVSAGDVVFVDDGDNVAPAYSVTVGDTVDSVGPRAATIVFNPPTVVTTVTPAPAPVPVIDPAPVPAPDPKPIVADPPKPDPDPDPEPDPEPEPEPDPEPEDEPVVGGGDDAPSTATAAGESFVGPPAMVDFDSGSEGGSTQGLLKSLFVRPAALTAMALQQSLPGSFEIDAVAREVRDVLASTEFNSSLDRMRDGVSDATIFHQSVVGSSVAVTTGLSVGYVAWLVRGGVLLSTALSSLPAWQFIDPLPVLARTRDGEDGDDDSLQSIIKEQSERAANRAKDSGDESSAGRAAEPGE